MLANYVIVYHYCLMVNMQQNPTAAARSADTNQPSGDSLITAEQVSLRLGGRQILHRVDLRIDPGRTISLIGPNGAGKTTLVRLVLGLLHADSGRIRRRPGLRTGYMPQKLHIEPTLPLTVERFLVLGGRQSPDAVNAALAEARIAHLRKQQMGSLSGGETQRVLLARALMRSPELLVLDEPAQGVDVSGQAELYQLISHIQRSRGCAVLMISHDLHMVMATTDEVVCLNQHICCHGKPEHVSTDPSYLALFGKHDAEALAIYTHRHNHKHNIDGDVVDHDHG